MKSIGMIVWRMDLDEMEQDCHQLIISTGSKRDLDAKKIYILEARSSFVDSFDDEALSNYFVLNL